MLSRTDRDRPLDLGEIVPTPASATQPVAAPTHAKTVAAQLDTLTAGPSTQQRPTRGVVLAGIVGVLLGTLPLHLPMLWRTTPVLGLRATGVPTQPDPAQPFIRGLWLTNTASVPVRLLHAVWNGEPSTLNSPLGLTLAAGQTRWVTLQTDQSPSCSVGPSALTITVGADQVPKAQSVSIDPSAVPALPVLGCNRTHGLVEFVGLDADPVRPGQDLLRLRFTDSGSLTPATSSVAARLSWAPTQLEYLHVEVNSDSATLLFNLPAPCESVIPDQAFVLLTLDGAWLDANTATDAQIQPFHLRLRYDVDDQFRADWRDALAEHC